MLRIKGWSSFQSYKDRRPPWIRLHKSLLDNYEFQMMSMEAKAILPMLWLLASEDEDPVSGCIRDGYKKVAFRLRVDEQTLIGAIQECEAAGFVEIIEAEKDSENQEVTYPLRNRHETVTPETETETETETEKRRKRFTPPTVVEVGEYCRQRKNDVDPQRFVDFYTAKGWKVGRNSMKDWKASVRTWEGEKKKHPDTYLAGAI
jgi:hypothetical protein